MLSWIVATYFASHPTMNGLFFTDRVATSPTPHLLVLPHKANIVPFIAFIRQRDVRNLQIRSIKGWETSKWHPLDEANVNSFVFRQGYKVAQLIVVDSSHNHAVDLFDQINYEKDFLSGKKEPNPPDPAVAWKRPFPSPSEFFSLQTCLNSGEIHFDHFLKRFPHSIKATSPRDLLKFDRVQRIERQVQSA